MQQVDGPFGGAGGSTGNKCSQVFVLATWHHAPGESVGCKSPGLPWNLPDGPAASPRVRGSAGVRPPRKWCPGLRRPGVDAHQRRRPEYRSRLRARPRPLVHSTGAAPSRVRRAGQAGRSTVRSGMSRKSSELRSRAVRSSRARPRRWRIHLPLPRHAKLAVELDLRPPRNLVTRVYPAAAEALEAWAGASAC